MHRADHALPGEIDAHRHGPRFYAPGAYARSDDVRTSFTMAASVIAALTGPTQSLREWRAPRRAEAASSACGLPIRIDRLRHCERAQRATRSRRAWSAPRRAGIAHMGRPLSTRVLGGGRRTREGRDDGRRRALRRRVTLIYAGCLRQSRMTVLRREGALSSFASPGADAPCRQQSSRILRIVPASIRPLRPLVPSAHSPDVRAEALTRCRRHRVGGAPRAAGVKAAARRPQGREP